MTLSAAEIAEEEHADSLDPLRHLFASSAREAATGAADTALLPEQQHSIVNERALVTYFADLSKLPTVRSVKLDEASPVSSAGSHSVLLHMDVTTGCGGKIWPAAEVLGAYISGRRNSQLWNDKTIMELGSGTGLVGLLVAKMDLGCKVWITDQIPMMDLMRRNTDLNTPAGSGSICRVEELNWGEPIPISVPPKPDVLLLADCVYLEVAFQPLVDTMVALSDQHTEILFCYQRRRKADKRFFGLLRKSFTFTDIDDDDPARRAQYNREGTYLYRIRRKQQ